MIYYKDHSKDENTYRLESNDLASADWAERAINETRLVNYLLKKSTAPKKRPFQGQMFENCFKVAEIKKQLLLRNCLIITAPPLGLEPPR